MAETTEKPVQVPYYKRPWVFGLGLLVLVVVIFCLGSFAGRHHQGAFIYSERGSMMAGERNWAFGPKPGYMMMGGIGYNMHSGTTGSITNISGNTLTIASSNGVTQTVIVSGSTQITRNRSSIKLSDLKTNNQVTVYGYLDSQGQLEASLIQSQ